MAKKYQPSGYYIINLDLTDKTSGTPFTPETDDEKLLLELIINGTNKPILINLSSSDIKNVVGFLNYSYGFAQIKCGSFTENFANLSTQLVWEEIEE